MTKLLQDALAELAKLPPERQDELAALLMAEIEADERWARSFAASQDVLKALADEALDEHRRGQTRPLDPAARDKE